MDTSSVARVEGFTGIYFIALLPSGQRRFVYYRRGNAASTLVPQEIDAAYLGEARMVFSSGITQGISPTCRGATLGAFQVARERGALVAFDANLRPALWPSLEMARAACQEARPYVHILSITSPEETDILVGVATAEEGIRRLWHQGVTTVVVKEGEQGCLLGANGQMARFSAVAPRGMVDTRGAGDAFNGGCESDSTHDPIEGPPAQAKRDRRRLPLLTRPEAIYRMQAAPRPHGLYPRLWTGCKKLSQGGVMTDQITPADQNNIRDKAAIVGIGETEFSWNSGRTELQLACEAIKAACDDAGISPHEIDALFMYDSENTNVTQLVSAMGIKNLRHWEIISYGGGAANATVAHAAGAIAAGYCNYAVCYRAGNLRSGVRYGQARGPARSVGQQAFTQPWGLLAAGHNFAHFVQRYMHKYGVTSRDLGWAAVTFRHHASRNPRALQRQPITIEDHQNSRWIVEPLHLLDFCQENDGAAAIVMTTADRVGHLRHADTVTLVEAAAQGCGPMNEGIIFRPDLSVAESEHTARDLWARARLSAKDMDAFMFYDHFSPYCLIALETWGFVPPGEAKDFVQGGTNIRFDGMLPVNTHGGNHSEAYIHGLTHPQEAVRLIRGTSTSQPPKQINRVLSCSNVAQLSAAVIIRRG